MAIGSIRHPETGCRWRANHIAGIGRKGDKFVVVIDLKRLLADDAKTLLSEPASVEAA